MTKSELMDWLSQKLEADRAQIERALEAGLAQAALDWPGVSVPLDAFGQFLLDRLGESEATASDFGALNLSDLYLACGLARADARALQQFDAKVLSAIDGALARVLDAAAEREEIRQRIREKLFVGGADQPPRIFEYRGEGDLRSWVAVVGVRLALNQVRARQREKLVDPGSLAEAAFVSVDPELFAMRREVRRDFEEAVKLALGRISVRQRNLLRHYFIDRLGIDELGTMFGVHRSTAARWLAQARQQVRDETRAILIERAKLREPEAESVMRLIDSQLELSLGGLFVTKGKPE